MAVRLKLRKPPRKPKRNSSDKVLESYLQRRKEWEKYVDSSLSSEKKRQALIKKVAGVSNSYKGRAK
jgi:hypothetical protein